jgi:hypothetical protein
MDQETQLETALRRLTNPINGQYPRPWMAASTAPWTSRIFTVGRNQKNGFPVEMVGEHDVYVDALFNRRGGSCRALYDRIVGQPSPTRINTDRLVDRLRSYGVSDVIETNVICYSTPISSDLRLKQHQGGKDRGTEIFRTIFDLIKPRVLVVHGAGTSKDLGRLLGVKLPAVPTAPDAIARTSVEGTDIWVIPSLAPPKWTTWMRWADQHIDLVCREVAGHLAA